MKIGDVIVQEGEQGVVEKIRGSTAYVRVFREDYEYRDWHNLPTRSGLYSHKTIEVELMDYYKNESFLNYLKYLILEILFETKQEPLLFLGIISILFLLILLVYLGVSLLVAFLVTL